MVLFICKPEDGACCWKWTFADDLTNAMENDFHIFRLVDVYLGESRSSEKW